MPLYNSDVYISIATINMSSAHPSYSNFGQTNDQRSSRRKQHLFLQANSKGGSLLPGSCRLCRHPPPTTAGLFLPATPTLKATAKPSKGSSAPRARKPCPQSSALRLCRPPLRFALSTTPCSVTRVGRPLSLQLLPPAFARWRSACMSHATATRTATTKEQRA